MKAQKGRFGELLKIFHEWLRYQDCHWGYADLAPSSEEDFSSYVHDLCEKPTYNELGPFEPKGHWHKKLEEYKVEHDRSGLVILPVYLERAYEILAERGLMTKDEVHDFRKKLIEWYSRDLSRRLGQAGLPVEDRDPEEIHRKSGLYKKMVDFYTRGDEHRPYYLEALKHIEAMDAKIELDVLSCRYNPFPEKYEMCERDLRETQDETDKQIMASLVATYASFLVDSFGSKEIAKKKRMIKRALEQVSDIFRSEG